MSVVTIDNILRECGLHEKEISVYKTCLTHGELTIVEISRITGIKRTTLYDILDELVRRSLLRFSQMAAHRLYEAQDPQLLRRDIERRAHEVKAQLEAFDRNLPVLSAPFRQSDGKPAVSVFRGAREIQRIIEHILNEKPKELCYVTKPGTFEQIVGSDYMREYVQRRMKKRIALRAIYTEDTVPHEIYLGSEDLLREVRIAPGQLDSATYTGIYDGSVFIITSAVEAYGILIRSADYSATMKSWFEVLWQASSVPENV